jgi:hypothetical protein
VVNGTDGDTRHNTNGGFAILVEHRPGQHVWIEESTEIVRSSFAATPGARDSLLLLPPPFGRLAATMSSRRLRELEPSIGPDGLWLKFDLSGLVSVRPRTSANKLKPPTPW